MDKRHGDGVVYKRDGTVCKVQYRHDALEGPMEIITTMSQKEVHAMFADILEKNDTFVFVNHQHKHSNHRKGARTSKSML